MQKIFTKNTAIVALVLISFTTSAYIAVTRFQSEPGKARVKTDPNPPRARNAVVDAAPILKIDGRLQACYQEFLKKGPLVDEGAVRLHFSIKKNGEIEGLRLATSELNDEEFTNCLIDEVRRRRVPVTPERLGVMINHKLNFKRRTPAAIDY